MAELKRLLGTKELEDMKWCDSKSQLADGLTKKGVLMDTLLRIAEEGRLSKI